MSLRERLGDWIQDIIDKIRGKTADPQIERPEPEPIPDAPSEPEKPSTILDASTFAWWAKKGEDGSAWPVAFAVEFKGFFGSAIDLQLVPEQQGGDKVLCVFVKRDGQWVGGGIDGFWQNGFIRKTLNNAKTGIQGRYGPNSEGANREYVKLRNSDSEFAVVVLNKGNGTRTDAVVIPYK